MNHWAAWLAVLPPTLQRAIARAQRIALPRRCDHATRTLRLRQALCHGRTVRAVFFGLPPEAQAALWALRACPRGLTADELVQRYGLVRPAHQLLVDPLPRTLSERLLLLGWLLPRPATPRHPERWLLPPELRRWLPAPLKLADAGVAPTPPPAPALWATLTVLFAAAEVALPVQPDARPTSATLRRLVPRLVPLAPTEAHALLNWLLPLLTEMQLLLAHGSTLVPGPAACHFLNQSADRQRQRLSTTWLHAAQPDRLLCRNQQAVAGLLWSVLRQRLLAWTLALPSGRLLDAATLFPALTAAFGPLADATTHGLRVVRRSPWSEQQAAWVWETALRGPLTWLGLVAWSGGTPPDQCFVTGRGEPEPGASTEADATSGAACSPWQYQADGRIWVPVTGASADLLALSAFAAWEGTETTRLVFRLDARSLRQAQRQGHSLQRCVAVLERRAGPLPADWLPALANATNIIRLTPMVVVLADDPALLAELAQDRATRRAIRARLAPGVATVAPEQVAAFTRAVERQGIVVQSTTPAPPIPPAVLTPAECAILADLCAQARRNEGSITSPAMLDALEGRLRAALAPALQAASGTGAPASPAELTTDRLVGLAPEARTEAALSLVQMTLRRRRALQLCYQPHDADASLRTVIPLRIEQHGSHWYLAAFCLIAGAERTFRLDRVLGATDIPLRSTRPPTYTPKRELGPTPRQRIGAAPPPPDRAPTPLMHVWIE